MSNFFGLKDFKIRLKGLMEGPVFISCAKLRSIWSLAYR